MLPQLESWVPHASAAQQQVFLRCADYGRPAGFGAIWFPYQRSSRGGRFVGGYCRAWWLIYLFTATMFGVDELGGSLSVLLDG